MPTIMPWRRRSNGVAASLHDVSSVAAAPLARKPAPIHGSSVVVASSADHDDHAAAAAGADPVLGQARRPGRRRARGVDLRVRAARADQLGELRVAHRPGTRKRKRRSNA
jgi:hypothetical protein